MRRGGRVRDEGWKDEVINDAMPPRSETQLLSVSYIPFRRFFCETKQR